MDSRDAPAGPRFIFITGGVVSSLGKGLTAAALGALLQARGYRVRLRKLDPYLNIDPGTMSPTQHGEVFVTDDGAETDLDLGHYERFTGVPARRCDSVTTGQVYWRVLTRERRGDYLGATVQVIPHITDALKQAACADTEDADFVLCEIGGTVGDIEGLPFLEAIRQLRNELGAARSLFMHLTLVPFIASAGEQKTKPTQHSVKDLLAVGIQPDILVCRTEREIDADARAKLALFCNVAPERVIQAIDVDTIYAVPGNYRDAGLDREVCRHFQLPDAHPDTAVWDEIVRRTRQPQGRVTVGLVGKYTRLADSYKSLLEPLDHAGLAHDVKVEVRWIEAELFERADAADHLQDVHAILVPGGFGQRGSEGKIAAARFARERCMPYLGICLGMQLAVVEVARNLAGLPDAGSAEFGDYQHPVIQQMTAWQTQAGERRDADAARKGGTMRLGAYPARIDDGSRLADIYATLEIAERHRHRYEVDPGYHAALTAAGLRISAKSPDGTLAEAVELPDHPFFIAVQYHPELKSRPFAPHPLFDAFVAAALRQARLT